MLRLCADMRQMHRVVFHALQVSTPRMLTGIENQEQAWMMMWKFMAR